jgi:hypothetical protein
MTLNVRIHLQKRIVAVPGDPDFVAPAIDGIAGIAACLGITYCLRLPIAKMNKLIAAISKQNGEKNQVSFCANCVLFTDLKKPTNLKSPTALKRKMTDRSSAP